MTSVTVELPDKLAQQLAALINAGWFVDEAEAMRHALLEFLQRNRLDLIEQFQLEDIDWVLDQRDARQ